MEASRGMASTLPFCAVHINHSWGQLVNTQLK